MNTFERIIYNLVKKNPGLKNFIRDRYQDCMTLFQTELSESAYPIDVREGYFFGFHDVSPFSCNGELLLAHGFVNDFEMPSGENTVDVGYFDLTADRKFVRIGDTNAWNWHKGARLQWIDESRVIFNKFLDSGLGAVIFDICDGSSVELQYAIDTASPGGLRATTFDYKVLEEGMPGYGYRHDDRVDFGLNETKRTELGEVIFETGKYSRLLSLDDVACVSDFSSDDNEAWLRFFTHSNYSRCGQFIYFLHRRVRRADVYRRETELGVFDRNSREVKLANTNGMVSHYDVTMDGNLIVYASIDGESAHFLLHGSSLEVVEAVGTEVLTSDGHQSCSRSTPNLFLVDSYPDRFRMANLYLGDLYSQSFVQLARLRSPSTFRAPSKDKYWVCDLHPRFNHDNTMVCFDSTHTGNRALCTMKLPNDIVG